MKRELDLIPVDYRENIHMILWLRKCGIIAAVPLVLIVISWGGFYSKAKTIKEQSVSYQIQDQLDSQKQQQLGSLEERLSRLKKHAEVMVKLRDRRTIPFLFETIDNAITKESVWFERVSFIRSTPWIGDGDEKMLPEIKSDLTTLKIAGKEHALLTYLEINGFARDYIELSKFTNRLVSIERIKEAKVVDTKMRAFDNVSVVAFTLRVFLNEER